MSDSERDVEIPPMEDPNRVNVRTADDVALGRSSDGDEQRDGADSARSRGTRTNADDLDPSMNASRNQDYGEVM